MSAATSKKELALLCLALVALAALALRPSIRGNDGVGNYVYLASLVRGGDLDFRDDYRAFDALKHYPYHFSDLPVSPQTGRSSNRYGIGSALLWSPFVLAVHEVLRVADPARADGLGRPYEWAVGLGTAWWGSLALGLLYVRLRRSWRPLACAATLAGLVLATPLGFYLYAHGSMSHGVSFFAATGAMLAVGRAWRRPDWKNYACCGCWCALLLMTRAQDAPWALLIGGALAWRWITRIREKSRQLLPRQRTDTIDQGSWATFNQVLPLVCFGLFFTLCFLPQLTVWKYLYGSWLSGPAPYLQAGGGAGEFSVWPRHLAGVLVGERGGVLAWHPFYLAGLIGLACLARRGQWRLTAVLGLVGFALQLWLVASWSMWWGGASFGNRFFLSALPFLAPGVAWWLGRERPPAGRRVAYALLAALIIWNAGLLYQYGTEMIPREEPVPWTRVIRQNVTAVPASLWHRLARR